MPQRLLKSGITTSRRFNALDWPAQSFFVRLITIVDDYGRTEADHSLLASLCFPMYRADKCPHIADICQQLAVNGMAIFYTVDGTDYLQLTRWKERVRSESRHPAPPADICQQFAAVCGQMIASPPQPTPQPQPTPTPRAREGGRLHGIPSSVEDVIHYGRTTQPPVSDDRCRAFFSHYEGQARTNHNGEIFWVTSADTVITNWKVKLPEFRGGFTGTSGDGTPRKRPPKPHVDAEWLEKEWRWV